MRKAYTPVVAVTLILLTVIVVLGVINFWFVQISQDELTYEILEVEVDCSKEIVIENYGFPNSLGPVVVNEDGENITSNLLIRKIVINCK